MSTVIYKKTDKGREEIATRHYGLPHPLRILLLLLDGKKPAEAVLEKLRGLGVTPAHLEQLCEADFLDEVEVVLPPAEPELENQPFPDEDAQTWSPVAADASADGAGETVGSEVTVADDAAARTAVEPKPVGPEEPPLIPALSPELPPLQQLYLFYTETIRTTVGLRAYGLQLKVEYAESVEDFQHLRAEYLQTIRQAKGQKFASILAENLDLLLRQSTAIAELALGDPE